MREIKFRIYNPREARMVESGSTPMMLHSFFKATAPFETRDGMEYQQFIGLKDRNGKETYEGDIVEIDGGGEPVKTSVFFQDGCFCVDMLGNPCEIKYYINMTFCEIEIIGNIYENPELLESK